MASVTQTYGTYTILTATGFVLNNSTGTGFLSKYVENTGVAALDYEIFLSLSAINTAPANDKAVYVYALPWIVSGGTTWFGPDAGTTTLPTTGETSFLTISSPNNMKLLGVANYTTQNQPVRANFFLSNAFGSSMPDAWSLFLMNYGGPTFNSANSVGYRAISMNVI